MISIVHDQGVVKPTYMVVYRFEDLLGRNQQRCHLPNSHLKVHLRELEESVPPIAYQPLLPFTSLISSGPYLLKKRGIRTLDPRVAGVEPKLAEPACWRGREM
jgi:hypothetical protein